MTKAVEPNEEDINEYSRFGNYSKVGSVTVTVSIDAPAHPNAGANGRITQ